eukprot:GHVS01108596.1.p1 GENE.GHVS01108596.1~~GHVS01108596.1.p1  ORF type:complete len:576 (-),score=58.43 GHVS01108596.1:464-2191(-)
MGVIVSMSLLSWYCSAGLMSILLLATCVEGNDPQHTDKLPLLTTAEDLTLQKAFRLTPWPIGENVIWLQAPGRIKLLLSPARDAYKEDQAAALLHHKIGSAAHVWGDVVDGRDSLPLKEALKIGSNPYHHLSITLGIMKVDGRNYAVMKDYGGFIDMTQAEYKGLLNEWSTSTISQHRMLNSLGEALQFLHDQGIVHSGIDDTSVLAKIPPDTTRYVEWEYLLHDFSSARTIKSLATNYATFLEPIGTEIELTDKHDLYLLGMTHALSTSYGSPLRYWMDMMLGMDEKYSEPRYIYEEMIRLAVLGPLDLGKGTATNNDMKVGDVLLGDGSRSRIRIFSALALVPKEELRVSLSDAEKYLTTESATAIEPNLQLHVYGSLLRYCISLVGHDGMNWLKSRFINTMKELQTICRYGDNHVDESDGAEAAWTPEQKSKLCLTVDVLCAVTDSGMDLKMSEDVKKIYKAIDEDDLQPSLRNGLAVLFTFDLLYADFEPYLWNDVVKVEKSSEDMFKQLAQSGTFGKKKTYYERKIKFVDNPNTGAPGGACGGADDRYDSGDDIDGRYKQGLQGLRLGGP